MQNGQYEVLDSRVQTRSLEVHVVDHCNLHCWGCCSLSPWLPPRCVDPAALERDLRMARRVLAPRYFKLVGGEPLLHPAIDDCLEVARRSEIAPVVSVSTNGFLLPRMSDRFWRLAQALTVSLYPQPALPAETVAAIERRAAEHGLPVNWKRQDVFLDMDLPAPRPDADLTREVYDHCWLRRRCHILSDGRFFTCTRPPHLETLLGPSAGRPLGGNEPLRGNEEAKNFLDDGVVLDESPRLAEAILDYLRRPEPLRACSLCRGGGAPARPHRQMPRDEPRTIAAGGRA